MTGPPSPGSSSAVDRPSDDRLDSWKEIAAYMRRDVTTVQRWERREGMPVHRHVHDKMGSVYALKTDLDAWARRRSLALVAEPDVESVTITSTQPSPIPAPRRRRCSPASLAGDQLSGLSRPDAQARGSRKSQASAERCSPG
jgi:hypothetical protein